MRLRLASDLDLLTNWEVRICLLQTQSSNASLCAKLITDLSRRFPKQEHEPFHLEHRLFTDTSSQLPSADIKQRAFTHIFSSSHDTRRAFVHATKPEGENGSSITVPIGSAEIFTGLLVSKMQPLWFPRSMLSLENGVSVPLKDDTWRICIGELKVAPRSPGAGNLRGTIIELYKADDSNLAIADKQLSAEEIAETQEMFSDILRQIFRGTEETFSNAKFSVSRTQIRASDQEEHQHQDPDWELAKLYMTALRGQR